MIWAGLDALVLLIAAIAAVVLFQRAHDTMSGLQRFMLFFFTACCVTYMWQEVRYAEYEWRVPLSQIGLHAIVALFLVMRALQAKPRPFNMNGPFGLTHR